MEIAVDEVWCWCSYAHDAWLWDLDWRMAAKASVPRWYKELMTTTTSSTRQSDEQACDTGAGGPELITSQMRIAVKLLKLKWDGLPLHYDKKMKWGVLVPGRFSPEFVDSKFMDMENKAILPVVPVEKTSPMKVEIMMFPMK